MKPKECAHDSCRNIMYVPDWKLHMILICDKCVEKKEGAN